MNGYNIAFVSEKTGIAVGKLKMLVNRHPALQGMPYSVKNGGNRVFFDDFVVWLKQYEGVTSVESNKSHNPVTSVTRSKLPNGKQMEVLYRAAKDKLMTPVQFQEAIGVTIPSNSHRAQLPAPVEARASHEQIAAELRSLIPVAGKAVTKADEAANMARGRVIAKETAKIVQDRLNFWLPLSGNPA